MSTTPFDPNFSTSAAPNTGEPNTKEKIQSAADQAIKTAEDAAARAAEFSRSAVHKLDSKRDSVAAGLEKTADAMRRGPATVAEKASTAAGKLEGAAGYVRRNDLRSMGADITSAVRNNPAASLLSALACGFLLGKVMRRD